MIITLVKNGLDSIKKLLECNHVHTPWPSIKFGNMEEIVEDEGFIEEDVNIHEIEFTDGNNELVKSSNQNCVLCLNGLVII